MRCRRCKRCYKTCDINSHHWDKMECAKCHYLGVTHKSGKIGLTFKGSRVRGSPYSGFICSATLRKGKSIAKDLIDLTVKRY